MLGILYVVLDVRDTDRSLSERGGGFASQSQSNRTGPTPVSGGGDGGTRSAGSRHAVPDAGAAVERALGLDRAARRVIQQGLAAAGFDPGEADGVFGPGTRAALRVWQTSRGDVATGYLNRLSVAALRADVEATRAGGGEVKTPNPPSKGRLPIPAKRQLSRATPKIRNPRPVLPVEPTVIVPQLVPLPAINLPDYGDPLGIPGFPSVAPRSAGGIGTDTGTGVDPGEGSSVASGIGGGVFRVDGGVTPPTVLRRFEPVYPIGAKKAGYEGVVVLSAIVRKNGTIEIVKVIRSLGLGLDEAAIRAIKKWKFRPGMKDGNPVDVALNVEVNFSLGHPGTSERGVRRAD